MVVKECFVLFCRNNSTYFERSCLKGIIYFTKKGLSKPIPILIGETSSIIYEGLVRILNKSSFPVQVWQAMSILELDRLLVCNKASVVIANPSFFLNNTKQLNAHRNEYPESRFLALVYAYFEPQLIALFDGVVHITDSQDTIVSLIKKALTQETVPEPFFGGDTLSDRETEVLKLMASGFSNKEIADKLNISINTAITHRKNISQKTGIKSISGLTIYAVMKKLINLDSIPE